MSKPKILVLGAGGAAGIGMTRCLSDFDVYGEDDGEFGSKLMEVENEHSFYNLYIPVPTALIEKWADKDNVFLPPKKEIELCNDKAKLAEVLGDLAPKTYWVRDTEGSGGKGAKMCSEYLPGKNYACEVIYKNGELKGWFQKERISYSSVKVSHKVGGSAMVAKCVNIPILLDKTKQALARFTDKPHGIYAIDFKENEKGEPLITEINAGRFVTSSYVFYNNGYNLPKLMVELALDLPITPLGEYPLDKLVIRQVDRLPYYGD